MFFAHTQTDQEGLNMSYPWHIYSNPICPPICPVLALAKYLFWFPELLVGNCKLFPGGGQYSRFSKGLSRLFKNHKDDIEAVGFDVSMLGRHSARKGATTLCSTGRTISPYFFHLPACRLEFRNSEGEVYTV